MTSLRGSLYFVFTSLKIVVKPGANDDVIPAVGRTRHFLPRFARLPAGASGQTKHRRWIKTRKTYRTHVAEGNTKMLFNTAVAGRRAKKRRAAKIQKTGIYCKLAEENHEKERTK